jgi:hypothetical protein
MEPTRNINAYSPEKPETLVVQTLSVQIGDVAGARPVVEVFFYDASTMASGIFLLHSVAAGTAPAVYLRGLRLVLREAGETTGGDVALVQGIDPVSGDLGYAIVFVGDAYAVAPGDVVVVDYWTAD